MPYTRYHLNGTRFLGPGGNLFADNERLINSADSGGAQSHSQEHSSDIHTRAVIKSQRMYKCAALTVLLVAFVPAILATTGTKACRGGQPTPSSFEVVGCAAAPCSVALNSEAQMVLHFQAREFLFATISSRGCFRLDSESIFL